MTMLRGTWTYDNVVQSLVPKHEYLARRANRSRSGLPCPAIIGDTIELKSMVDGKTYTSKAALRQSYRERGYAEVGTEEIKPVAKPKHDKKAIRESIMKAKAKVGLL